MVVTFHQFKSPLSHVDAALVSLHYSYQWLKACVSQYYYIEVFTISVVYLDMSI